METKMTTDQAREHLVVYMEQNFTDKTFHRYIRGQISTGGKLAGDFAWQMATALKKQRKIQDDMIIALQEIHRAAYQCSKHQSLACSAIADMAMVALAAAGSK